MVTANLPHQTAVTERVALFSPDPNACNQRGRRMAHALAENGYQVDLYSACPTPVSDRVTLHLILNQDGTLSGPMPDLSKMDLVQVSGRDLLQQVAAVLPASTRLIFDVPGATLAPDDGRSGSWLRGIKRNLGAWRAAPRIDAVICPSYLYGEYLQREMQLKQVPVVPIYPALPLQKDGFSEPAGWQSKGRLAVAVYQADLADLDLPISAVGRLNDIDLVAVNCIGDALAWRDCEDWAREWRMGERLHRVDVPESQALATLAQFRLGLVLPRDTSQESLYDIPPALFSFMMAGVPVVTSTLPGIERLVAAQNFGFLADPNEPVQVSDMIGRGCSDDAAHKRLSHNVAVVREHRYAWEVQQHRLLSLYQQLLTGVAG